jgi:hypothetical protein
MAIARTQRTRRADLAELTSEQERQLLHGAAFIVPYPFRTLDEMRPAWEIHRDRLRGKWAAEQPVGTRCFAEWAFELIPKFGERRATECYRPEHQEHGQQLLTMGILHTSSWPEMQEPEHEYLFRNGVIDAAEYAAACAEEADDPDDEADDEEP